ncbi:Phospholipase A2 [Nibea albiflora]|uniref:Phospholipase A2 n=1 Tax=Nibea albiflora TaxID=240163 RepID=A0ACB7F1B0_NIBAL|nr:Phospholipase A2 [Nibea albiflora]
MFLLFCCLCPFAVAVASAGSRKSQRTKRGLLELAGAIKCSTGRSALAYMMYGCYCGLGGQGWPRDRADWCCHRHDCCYGDAELLGCQTKTDQYQWTCEDKTAECACLRKKTFTCAFFFADNLKDKCEKFLCKCDRDAAKCLRKSPFIRKYALWPDFLCGHEHPMCNIY